ncbi:hypothetical protein B0H67DRAFT_521535 [Lasiosphaeris hirsuta]|uniref:DUF6594 domain-containing protein n=1 Tax=Lasiosphaeris hirsuta TaxID=260670 RepID=A0AA40DI60_9PEZI|nr:hypothetical protein B0H67DRAFT_521535 [Lasiosphaeris hirsuta]
MGPSTAKPLDPPINGYETLGKYIGSSPEYAVFHGFRELYAENLLYLQAEIVYLSKELEDIRGIDRTDKQRGRGNLHQDWAKLRASDAKGDGRQLQKILELREALDKYYESVLRYEKIVNMKKPQARTLKNMLQWMLDVGDVGLVGNDWNIYADKKPQPMMTLDHTSDDEFTTWVQTTLVEIYHQILGRRIHKSPDEEHLRGTISYPVEKVGTASRFIAATIACALPTASIFGLHFVSSTTVRLGIVFATSVVFALCMACMTSAKTQEIFSATATFSAVLVVFIGTDASTA